MLQVDELTKTLEYQFKPAWAMRGFSDDLWMIWLHKMFGRLYYWQYLFHIFFRILQYLNSAASFCSLNQRQPCYVPVQMAVS